MLEYLKLWGPGRKTWDAGRRSLAYKVGVTMWGELTNLAR